MLVRFDSNIQINYEDAYTADNFDSTTAKLEIGNLQIQLIEGLKLQQQKDKLYKTQCEEVND